MMSGIMGRKQNIAKKNVAIFPLLFSICFSRFNHIFAILCPFLKYLFIRFTTRAKMLFPAIFSSIVNLSMM